MGKRSGGALEGDRTLSASARVFEAFDFSLRTALASRDPDDRPGSYQPHVAAGLRARNRLANAAATGHSRGWRSADFQVLSLILTPTVYYFLTVDSDTLFEWATSTMMGEDIVIVRGDQSIYD
jgi:hypothetical protein